MKTTLLNLWSQRGETNIKITKPLPIGEGVIDESGFSALEIDALFNTVNYAETQIGQSVLFRSLVHPLAQLKDIEQKQRAVQELQDNSELKATLQTIVSYSAQEEFSLYKLLFGQFLPMFGTAKSELEIEGYGYSEYRRAIRFVREVVESLDAIAEPESDYLRELLEHIKAFTGSRIYGFMTKAVFLTETTLQTYKEHRKSWWKPAIVFYPRLFKPLFFTGLVLTLGLLLYFLPSFVAQAILVSPLLLLYYPIVGGFDRDNFIMPLREIFKNSSELGSMLEALGKLDELLSIVKFAENFPHPTVMPSLLESEHHRIVLNHAVNPILGKENPTYVGNDLSLDYDKMWLITGPNSGGKTAFCKTVAQIQLLAQIGSVVPAHVAMISIADRIFYQTPEISRLNDGEGRFGAELKRTKDIFLACSAKSLVILDELSEGTTFEEKLESSLNILNGFYRKGNSTLLITHNHQLVDILVKQHLGIPKQVEFLNDQPTHQIIDGISRVSHADRVAKKIGFSKEDIENYLSS